MGALLVMYDRGPRLCGPLFVRLAVPVHDRNRVLVGVDHHGDAYEVARQPLPHRVVSGDVLEGRVLYVHLVYPAFSSEAELGVVAHEPDELYIPLEKITLHDRIDHL